MEDLKQLPMILSVNEVAGILGITSRTVRILVNKNEIRCFRIGRRIKIRKDWLIEYIERNSKGKNEKRKCGKNIGSSFSR